jgi:alpha-mannosidase
VSNENATYNLGVGTISRGNNNEKKFEVPSKEWIDLTDKSGKYGVSILEDCKYGSDKPDDNTLRLTLLYTPKINTNGWSWLMYQSTQDWGIHDVKYAVYSHEGNFSKAETPWQAKFLNQPLLAFETTKHNGESGRSISMISINNPQVGLMAFKKMEQDDYYLVRVNELSGKDLQAVKLTFPAKISNAFEVNGQEQKIGETEFKNGTLEFDLSHYTIRSFAVKFMQQPAFPLQKLSQKSVDLPFDTDVISYDENREDGNFADNQSLPAELVPDIIESEDIKFEIKHKTDGENNAVACNGQILILPEGNYTQLYMLAAANEDAGENFNIDGKITPLKIQKWSGYVGQFYNRILSRDQNSVVEMQKPFVKTDNIAWFASHCHNAYPMRNEAYQYCYLFKYEIEIPAGAKTLILPDNKGIKLLALTVTSPQTVEVKPLQPLYDNFQNNDAFKLITKQE